MDKLEYKVTFIDYCIQAFAEQYKLKMKEAYAYLNRFKGIDFLDDCYEAEHQVSMSDVVDDLTKICLNNGGLLK